MILIMAGYGGNEGFVQALGRRLARGPGFIREVSVDIGDPDVSSSPMATDLAQGQD
jgi:hypothetical protein